MRKQIIILGILLLPMIPGSAKLPEIGKEMLTLGRESGKERVPQDNNAEAAKQAVTHPGNAQESGNNEPAASRYKRAGKTKNIDQLQAMSENEARRMMRTGDTKAYRSELERYDLIRSNK